MATARRSRGLDKRLARLRQVQAKLDEVAGELLDAAKHRANAHRDTGQLAASLTINSGRVDRRVESDDPNILAIEYGHTDPRTGEPADGLHVLGGAAADVASRR